MASERDDLAELLPAHYFDCDRFNIYDYGTRQGDCDCTATADLEALAATVQRVRALCDEADGEYWEKPSGAAVVLLDDLRAALAPPPGPAAPGGHGEGRA